MPSKLSLAHISSSALRLATLLVASVALCLGMASHPSWAAADVRGVKFPDTHEVASQTLQLNGAGVRIKLVFDVYAASLYLPHKEHSSQSVITASGAKSVQAVLLRDLTAEEFVSAMVKGFKANNSEADVTRLTPRLESLEKMMLSMGKAPKGTRVHIDFVPGTGTRILVNGQKQGSDIPGDDFYQALLRIWLGPKPVDAGLKSALLGGE
jgi:Chalcone isomerase-like